MTGSPFNISETLQQKSIFYFEKSESNVTRPQKSKCILQRSIKLLQLINANVKWIMKLEQANLWNEMQFVHDLNFLLLSILSNFEMQQEIDINQLEWKNR